MVIPSPDTGGESALWAVRLAGARKVTFRPPPPPLPECVSVAEQGCQGGKACLDNPGRRLKIGCGSGAGEVWLGWSVRFRCRAAVVGQEFFRSCPGSGSSVLHFP
ncbi:hypothetical protein GCM10022380_34370 [Amycolatopsis tucumanensis]|uniref:Uncharacterized protein n=1 Tax=Amycolatopsis tucumanensis TaxID=401106 RepID=A0ABP7IAH3_9PSEU